MGNLDDEMVDRRGFIKALAATGAAAAVTGVGIATWRGDQAPVGNLVATAVPATSSANILPIAQEGLDAAGLRAQLAAAQAENARLQAALLASEHQLSLYQEAETTGHSAAESLQLELQSANRQVTALTGLVALYEQLEGVNLAGTINAGLALFSGRLAEMAGNAPTLRQGIAAGRDALQEVEGHIPLLQNGRIWLGQHIDRLDGFYDHARRILEEGSERLGSFLEMLNNWVQEIRKWLPFNLGQRTTNLMESLARVLGEVPHTLSGLKTNVAQPLDEWLARDGEETTRLERKLVQPLRARVLTQSEALVSQTEQLEEIYQTQVSQPWESAVARREAVRQLIANYRAEHQV